MIILREKVFGKIKYPEDWDEKDFEYLDKIDKESDKKIVKDALVSTGLASLPSITGMLINGKFKPKIKTGLVIGGASFLLNNALNDTKDLKTKYRKIKNKKDRDIFQRETELSPSIIKTIKDKGMLLL